MIKSVLMRRSYTVCPARTFRVAFHLVTFLLVEYATWAGRSAQKTYIIGRQCIRSSTDKLLDKVHSSPPKHQVAYRLDGQDVLISAGDAL